MNTVFPLAIADDFNTLPYLSLGMVAAHLRNDGRITSSYKIHSIMLGGVAGYPLSGVYDALKSENGGLYLLSSYVWNLHRNLEVAQQIKNQDPSGIVIIGGPEIPKYSGETEAFLRANPCIDIAILGEGEAACADVLLAIAQSDAGLFSNLESVEGIVYSRDEDCVRTAERSRIRDINTLPSPYLTGEFEPWFNGFANTILETNRGCPYGCTYCDWGSATLQKVTKFDTARVIAEIEYIAEKESEAIFIADANFGMLEQDIEIAAALVEVRERTGYPKRLYSNFAKNGGRRLMQVIKILHAGGLLPTGIIALQTTDDATLKAIKRDNIKTSAYEKMMEYFNSENIPMASDIMIGLPGQTIDSLEADLQFCFDWKVSANGNYTSMMPNAPMAESGYRSDYMIVTDDNNMVESTSSFSKADMAYMKSLFMVYQFHVRLGVLKYYLYYQQIEHNIPALAFLRCWLDCVEQRDERLPISIHLFEDIFSMEKRTGDWALMSWGEEALPFFQNIEQYYREIQAFSQSQFGVEFSHSVSDALCKVQCAVNPKMDRQYPYEVELTHDVVAYFDQVKVMPHVNNIGSDFQTLDTFVPSNLAITPAITKKKSIKFAKIDGHSDDWELPSKLRFY